MPQHTADQRVRSGAKSCTECRRRKVRCVWSPSSDTASGASDRTACDHCLARGRTCVPQIQRTQPSSTRTTARQRISHLEQEMASLAALVRDRNAPSSPSSAQLDRVDGGDGGVYDNLVDDLDRAEVEDSSPPSHLRLLFDTVAVESQDDRSSEGERRSSRLFEGFMQLARAKLRHLIPSQGEVLQISKYASSWMMLYHTLFPAFFAFRTGEQLVANHKQMQDGQIHPVRLAMYLLSVAITAQQVPSEEIPVSFYKGRGVTRYVDAVCRAVDHTIIGNDALAGTVEGLETALLCVRLSLGRGNLKGTWLTFRRIIALAELVGLPQANEELMRDLKRQGSGAPSQPDQQDLQLKADVWEAICTSDRNFSMMLNVPAGTARYRFPRDESIMRDGQVSSRAYNYRLSNICAAVFEIDESYMRGDAHAESYEKVLSADRQLRALIMSAPKSWRYDAEHSSLDTSLVKFWHHYITARVHLRPGLMNDFDEQYAYSRSTCREACLNAVRRFPTFRLHLPSGFFVCRVLDVQVFTAATFLLLSSRSMQHDPDEELMMPSPEPIANSLIIDLVKQVIDCFDRVSNEAGSDLAREARTALTALIELVQGGHSNQSEPLNLQIPLLGRIHINRAESFVGSDKSSVGHGAGGVPVDMPEYQNDVQLGGMPPHSSGFGASDGSTAMNRPLSWVFESDDLMAWASSNLSLDNMLGMEY